MNISASLVKDYLACKRRAYYRVNVSGSAVSSDEALAGTVVHNTIQKYPKEDFAVLKSKAIEQLREYNRFLPEGLWKRINRCLSNYKSLSAAVNYSTARQEVYFSFPASRFSTDSVVKSINVTGRIDLIDEDLVIDWKTSEVVPEILSGDVQFIFYYEAYKQLYGKYPKNVLLASLTKNKLVKYEPIQALNKALLSKIVPEMVRVLSSVTPQPYGLFTGDCKYCQFQRTCEDDLHDTG